MADGHIYCKRDCEGIHIVRGIAMEHMRDSHGTRIVRWIDMGHICYYGKELEIFDEERPKAGQYS